MGNTNAVLPETEDQSVEMNEIDLHANYVEAVRASLTQLLVVISLVY